MTDNEIIQALEKSLQMGDAPIGAHWGVLLTTKLLSDSLNLIKRQQAEIERLEKGGLKEAMTFNAKTIKEAAVEEVRLFLNTLKERAYIAQNEWSHGEHPKLVDWDDILDEFEQRYGEIE